MIDDDTKYVVIQTGYENNLFASKPNEYHHFMKEFSVCCF